MSARRRTLAVGCALIALAAMGVATADVSHAARKAPSQAKIAKRLVAKLDAAKTPAARQRALLRMMRALRINVVSRRGKPLAAAVELGAARSFYLYDFELRALAESRGRGATSSLEEVAQRLTQGGLALDGAGKAFPAALLAVGMSRAVRAAAKRPRARRALLPLVVRELGRRRGYDLARRPAVADVSLDPVAAWLVTADVVLPVLRRMPASAGRRAAATARAAAVPRASVAGLPDRCAQLDKKIKDLTHKAEDFLAEQAERFVAKKLRGTMQKWIAGKAAGMIYDKVSERLTRGAKAWGLKKLPRWAARKAIKGAKAANLAGQVMGLVHGSLLAFSIHVSSVDESLDPTHWGHGLDRPGEPRTVAVKVEMLDDYGELLVKCGKFAGLDLPPKGPVEGVTVGWEQAVGELAPKLATLDCAIPALCFSTTGKDGIARLTFTPHSERFPGVGIEREETGVVNGVALYQSAFGAGIAPEIAQFLTPKYAGARWFVSYHKPRGYRVRYTSTRKCISDSCTSDWGHELEVVYDVSVCGPDPYAAEWTGTMDDREIHYGPGNDPHDEPEQISFRLFPNRPSVVYFSGNEGDNGYRSEFMLVEGADTRMRIDTHREVFMGAPYSDRGIVQVEENPSCPEVP